MKKILYNLIVCAGVLTFAACDDSVEDNSRLTYLVDLQVEKAAIEHQVNTEFTAPKFTATENGVDVSAKVTVKGLDKVDEDKIGIYPISYSVANSDGYLSTAKQTVYVVDLNADTDISGDYKIDVSSSSGQKGSEQPVPFSSAYPLTIKKVATSIFTISDLFGGWFNLQQGWGGDFAFSADCFLTEAVTDNNTVRINPLADKLVMANQDEDEKEITVNKLEIKKSAEGYQLQMNFSYDGWTISVVADQMVDE